MVNLMPDSARWIWGGIFLAILVHHVAHLVRMHGVHRLWHAGHVLMGIGMAYMFLPPQYRDTPRWPWQVVFALATVLAGGYALRKWRKGIRIDLPWIMLIVGLGSMVYMWAMKDGAARAPITYALAIWFCGEAVGWFNGELCGRRENAWLPAAIGPLRSDTRAMAAPCLAGTHPLAYGASPLTRVTLGLMAVGMAYMFVGMQLLL